MKRLISVLGIITTAPLKLINKIAIIGLDSTIPQTIINAIITIVMAIGIGGNILSSSSPMGILLGIIIIYLLIAFVSNFLLGIYEWVLNFIYSATLRFAEIFDNSFNYLQEVNGYGRDIDKEIDDSLEEFYNNIPAWAQGKVHLREDKLNEFRQNVKNSNKSIHIAKGKSKDLNYFIKKSNKNRKKRKYITYIEGD